MNDSAALINAAGGRATVKVADVRDPDAMRHLADSALAADGRLDIFVNNAGVAWLAPIIDGDVEHWKAMLETNVLALLVGCQAAIRAMRSTGNPGRIVNISSVAAQDPAADLTRVFYKDDLVIGDSALFCATGITDSDLLTGVKLTGHRAETHSVLMRSRSGTVRHIHAVHQLDRKVVPLRSERV